MSPAITQRQAGIMVPRENNSVSSGGGGPQMKTRMFWGIWCFVSLSPGSLRVQGKELEMHRGPRLRDKPPTYGKYKSKAPGDVG